MPEEASVTRAISNELSPETKRGMMQIGGNSEERSRERGGLARLHTDRAGTTRNRQTFPVKAPSLSRAELTRLIHRWDDTRRITDESQRAANFACEFEYNNADEYL
jgi:hypothetical protein